MRVQRGACQPRGRMPREETSRRRGTETGGSPRAQLQTVVGRQTAHAPFRHAPRDSSSGERLPSTVRTRSANCFAVRACGGGREDRRRPSTWSSAFSARVRGRRAGQGRVTSERRHPSGGPSSSSPSRPASASASSSRSSGRTSTSSPAGSSSAGRSGTTRRARRRAGATARCRSPTRPIAALKAHRHLKGPYVFCEADGRRLTHSRVKDVVPSTCRKARPREAAHDARPPAHVRVAPRHARRGAQGRPGAARPRDASR